MKKNKAVKKPKMKRSDPYYDYQDIRTYILKKYGRDIDDWHGKFKDKRRLSEKPYVNFWHWFVDKYSVQDGQTVELHASEEAELYSDNADIAEILWLLCTEFEGKTAGIPIHCAW